MITNAPMPFDAVCSVFSKVDMMQSNSPRVKSTENDLHVLPTMHLHTRQLQNAIIQLRLYSRS